MRWLSLFGRNLPVHDKNVPPKVSVIIPCYNHGKFLADAVESVMRQTFNDWEIIIVDDGSTDNSAQIATELQQRFSGYRISVIFQPNGGLSNARNTGVSHSSAEYFLPLDADDKLHRKALEKSFNVLEKNPDIGFAYPRLKHFGAEKGFVWKSREYSAQAILEENFLVYSSLVRRSVWEAIGGYDETLREGYEDWNFWLCCADHDIKGILVPKPLLLYRKHASPSMLAIANTKREKLHSMLIIKHPSLYTADRVKQAQKFLEIER